MVIAGIAKNSFIDFPGQVACVLFVPGCNYCCFYCHNRSLIDGSHDILPLQDVMAFLKKRVGMLDGAVITGGEPTLQSDLAPFIRSLREIGYKVKLDTNGALPEVVSPLLTEGLCDYFAIDYKAPAARYHEICGGNASAKPVLKTIRLLLEAHADFEVRTTVIPQLKEEDLLHMAQELPPLPKYVLNRYRKPEKYLPCDTQRIESTAYSQSDIVSFVRKIQIYQPNATT